DGLLVRGLRGRDLRASGFHPRGGGDDLEIPAGDGEHDQVARVLGVHAGGSGVLARGAVVVEAGEVEDALAGAGADVEVVERADDLRNAGKATKAERGEVDLLLVDERVAGDVRKQVAALDRPDRVGQADALLRDDRAEIRLQAAA